MNERLEEKYLEWIFDQVGLQDGNPRKTHWDLLRLLRQREFVWIVPNDDNRLRDGLLLRHEFLTTGRLKRVEQEWESEGCTVLELILGLARRLSFEAEGEASEWFWHLLKNLGLIKFTDRIREDEVGDIEEIIDRLIWRQYNYDGSGGLFPLQEPHYDQRDVELWYQMSAYILELE